MRASYRGSTQPIAQGSTSPICVDRPNYSIVSQGKTVYEDDGSAYLTDKLTEYALEFIQSQSVEAPFFLYLAYSAPYLFIEPKADKVSKYMLKVKNMVLTIPISAIETTPPNEGGVINPPFNTKKCD